MSTVVGDERGISCLNPIYSSFPTKIICYYYLFNQRTGYCYYYSENGFIHYDRVNCVHAFHPNELSMNVKNVNVCFIWSMLKSRQLFCMHTTYDLYIKNLNTRRLQNQRRRDGQRDRDGVWSCFLLPLTRVCTNTNAINKSHLLKN